jgi:REP element-mobilizing transposase RayT
MLHQNQTKKFKPQKECFHVTASLHDSRTSKRMIEYSVRESRFGGRKPKPAVFPLKKDEEELIAQTIEDLVKEFDLSIPSFNLCWDHMHLILYCTAEEVPVIMHKIKGRTARECNKLRGLKGINPLGQINPLGRTVLKDKSTPFWSQKYYCKPITTELQLKNTINYILNNKIKHGLPENKELEKIISRFTVKQILHI